MAAAENAAARIARLIDALADQLASQADFATAYWTAAQSLPHIAAAMINAVAGELAAIARAAYGRTASQAAAGLPSASLAYVAAAALTEGVLTEAPNDLGAVLLTYTKAKSLRITDRIGRLKEPAFAAKSDAEQRAAFQRLILPPLSADQVGRIVAPVGDTWPQALVSRLAPPERLARIVADATSQGASGAEIARTLRAEFAMPKADAMRIARTNGVRISGDARMAAWEKLGPLIVGYQLRATLDAASRPWHAARNGQIYYKNPGPGQLGLDEMPRPPHEPQAAPWGGKIAWNCRCMLSAVFAPPPALTGDRLQPFTNNAGKVIPDPDSYSQWFARADERRRRLAVGSRRYETVVHATGNKLPAWSDFLDVDGELVPLPTLQAETPEERDARHGRVQKLLTQRREDLRRIATFGFDLKDELPPQAPAIIRPEPKMPPFQPPKRVIYRPEPAGFTHARKLLLPGGDRNIMMGLANARPGSIVTPMEPEGSVRTLAAFMHTQGGGVERAYRQLELRPGGETILHNLLFRLDPNERGKGTGLKVFLNQVAAAKEAGLERMETEAAGRWDDRKRWNGYHVWPRFGYDGTIPEHAFRRLSAELQSQMGSSRSVLKLFGLPGGPEEWKRHGDSIEDAYFDLRDGSPSLTALLMYARTKGLL